MSKKIFNFMECLLWNCVFPFACFAEATLILKHDQSRSSPWGAAAFIFLGVSWLMNLSKNDKINK